jgi:hypothetical protein
VLAPWVYLLLYTIYPLLNHAISFPQYKLLLTHYFSGAWLFLEFNALPCLLMALGLSFIPALRRPNAENRLFIFICVEALFITLYYFYGRPTILMVRSDVIMQQASAVSTFIFIFIYKVKGAPAAKDIVAKKKIA